MVRIVAFLLVAVSLGCSRQAAIPRGLEVAFGLPRLVLLNALISRGLIVEAVYQGQRGREFSLNFGGVTHEFVVKSSRGNMAAATATAWLASPHEFAYTHRLPGQAEAEISERFDGAGFASTIKGWQLQSGERVEVDLAVQGRVATQGGFDGRSTKTVFDVTGTVKGAGYSVDVKEQHESAFESAIGLRLLHRMRGSASAVDVTIGSVLHSDGSDFRFDAVKVRTEHRTKGFSTNAGVTALSGTVSRDGATFGRCVLQGQRSMLETAGGLSALDAPR